MDLSQINLGDIAVALASVAGAIGSIAVIYKAIAKIAGKALGTLFENHLKPITDNQEILVKDVRALRVELSQNNLQTARLDLTQALKHAPKEHKAILDLAWHYFIELGGNTYETGLFKEWAEKEGVDISHILDQMAHRQL